MARAIQILETLEDSELVQNMYDTEALIKDIIGRIETNSVLNVEDYNFINFVLEKTKINLTKANNILKVGEKNGTFNRRTY